MASTRRPTSPDGGRGRATEPHADDHLDAVATASDLSDSDEPRWDALRVPDGWRPVAEVARAAAARIEELTHHVGDCVQSEIRPYADGLVPREDLDASVRRNLEVILVGLAEHRGPTAEELAVRGELGTRRALQGMPIDALIQAYHVGYRELWLALVRQAPMRDPQTATQLLTAATTVWQWVHEVTDAFASAHAATVRSLEARAVGARQRFVELLVGGDLDGTEATELGASLGFDPGGRFVALAVRGATDDLHAVQLQHALAEVPGAHAVVSRGLLVVVVSQGSAAPAVVQACREAYPAAGIGVGSERDGLRGARGSLADARQVLEITEDAATQSFEDTWLWATLADANDRLAPLLRPGRELAASHPHLAEAVRAFAAAGFSVTEASRRLALHANTVAYRLDRWEELTGWDPRTFPGLVRSVAALRAGD